MIEAVGVSAFRGGSYGEKPRAWRRHDLVSVATRRGNAFVCLLVRHPRKVSMRVKGEGVAQQTAAIRQRVDDDRAREFRAD
jgi:hypothetical protein